MPAIIEAWRAGLFRREDLLHNLIAGIVVGVVALPLAMAFAIASGARPEQGLYTALVAGLIVTLIGGSRVQIAGPTGAFAVLLFGVTAKYGLGGLQVVTLIAGVMLLIFGLAKLGGVIRFIPESVILGFTAGIAIVIFVGQWENFFGLPKAAGETLFSKLPSLLQSLPQLDPTTTALGIASVIVLVLWPKIPVLGNVPSPMVVLVAGTVLSATVHPAGVATIGSIFGGIPTGLPPLTLPHLTFANVVELMQPAFAIALLGAIESLLSATVADGLMGTRHDPNQELVGQGVANMAASMFGGFAATGALARTATSIRHGGNSPVAGLAHVATIVLVLVALAPLAFYIPMTTLAAILFVVAYNMGQFGRVFRITRTAPRSDVVVMLVTLALSVFADLSLAVEVGVVLALLNFFRRMTSTVDVRTLEGEELASRLPAERNYDVPPEGVLVYTIDGPFFFGATEQFESALLHTGTDPETIIIKLANVPFIDLTGLVALKDAVEALEKRGVRVALCGANEEVAKSMMRAEIKGTVEMPASATLHEAIQAVSEGTVR